ncbi:30S ribosomal protein S14 [Listeria monocytogenes]|nr:30S ribosomal protein S14 [Listeria monocytogenes]
MLLSRRVIVLDVLVHENGSAICQIYACSRGDVQLVHNDCVAGTGKNRVVICVIHRSGLLLLASGEVPHIVPRALVDVHVWQLLIFLAMCLSFLK